MKLNSAKEKNYKSSTKTYNETPQDQNGSKESNICLSECKNREEFQLCALCSNWTNRTTADLNNKNLMTMLNKLNVSDDIYTRESKAVCVSCVFKASSFIGLRGKCSDISSSEIPSLVNKLSVNNKVKTSEENSKSEQHSSAKGPQINNKKSLITVNSASVHKKFTKKQKTKNNRLQKENTMKQQLCPNLSSSTDSAENNCALDILFERREPPVDTESGGNINTYLRYYCQTCPMMFPNQTELNAHVRSHPVTRKSSSTSINGERKYRCSGCSSTFTDAKRLKEHKRIHLKRLYCHLCHSEQFNKLDHEFHVAECMGKKMATENGNPKENNKTRRALTRTLSKSMQSIEEEPTIAASVSSFDDFDESSLASTSVKTEINSIFISIKYPPDPFLAQKSYECHLLDKLISAFSQNVFTCYVINCNYSTNIIRNLCRHEVLRHKMKARYFCKKCNGRFTRKVYLDYHLHVQTSGHFICGKCGTYFVYQLELDKHVVEHGTRPGFKCDYCRSEFLTEQQLLYHFNETFHNHETRIREKIVIQNSIKIVNEVPMDPPQKRTSTIQDKVMKLPQIPSKRPIQLPWHKQFRIFLGDFEFGRKKAPNCSGSNN